MRFRPDLEILIIIVSLLIRNIEQFIDSIKLYYSANIGRMWHWAQGRLQYFQFDTLKLLSRFALNQDFKSVSQKTAHFATGLPFLPERYMPWRNYSRVLKLSLIVSERDGKAIPTPVAMLLSQTGAVTCDEYMHFVIQTFTEPSPALKRWLPNANFRFPLIFTLRYILTKLIVLDDSTTNLHEIIGAYEHSQFTGEESETDFIMLVNSGVDFLAIGRKIAGKARQARESLKVISQISYIHYSMESLVVSLDPADAREIFYEMEPLQGQVASDPNDEIFRLANFFKGGSSLDFFDYRHTVLSNVLDSGFTENTSADTDIEGNEKVFAEGTKVKRTHITIERNKKLRKAFFERNPTSVCDACTLDTKRYYPWTDRVLDLHHLLPLSSGTRVEAKGTMLNDLVPVCPTCHRAIHCYYDRWLRDNSQADFENHAEAAKVYQGVREVLEGGRYA